MPLQPELWHARFVQQARWTQSLRQYLYNLSGLSRARRILDVGCGTGVLLPELQSWAPTAAVTGLDLDLPALRLALEEPSTAGGVQGNALGLPFPTASFDIVVCHFLLLWVPDPRQAVAEMRRVTRPGGDVLALAEPDYGGRVDYPPELAWLGEQQAAALRSQGAEPEMGRRLKGLFHAAGLQGVRAGVLGGEWSEPPSTSDQLEEWAALENDLHESVEPQILARLQTLETRAWETGERILFVPTFYAWGKAPEASF